MAVVGLTTRAHLGWSCVEREIEKLPVPTDVKKELAWMVQNYGVDMWTAGWEAGHGDHTVGTP